MKRIILILIVVAVGAYFTYNHFEGKARERDEKKVEKERVKKLKNSVRDSVAKMASKFGAIDDWERKLSEKRSGKNFRILTIELEKLWLTHKPILFKGYIKDIYSLDRNTYSLSLGEQIDFSSNEPYLETASSHVVKQKIQFLEKKYKYPFQITINTPIASLF